jgi:hypothetical protein
MEKKKAKEIRVSFKRAKEIISSNGNGKHVGSNDHGPQVGRYTKHLRGNLWPMIRETFERE